MIEISTRVVRLATVLAISVGAGALGTVVAIYTYLLVSSPGGATGLLRLALLLAPSAILRSIPLAIIGGVAALRVWQSRYRSGVALVAAASGVVAGRVLAGHSPHVSPALAMVCTGFAWTVTSAFALLVFDRRGAAQ